MLLPERERRLQVPQVSFADTRGGSLFLLDTNCSSPDGLHGLHGGNGLFTSGQWWKSQPFTVLLQRHPGREGEWHLASARCVSKSGFPRGPTYTTREMVGLLLARSLLGPSWVRVRATGIFFCRVWMEYNTYYVKVSCLFQLLPSWSSGFVCLFVFGVVGQVGRLFVCDHRRFQVASFFTSKPQIHEAKRKARALITISFLGSQGA